MAGFGARAYGRLGLETDVIAGDPHRLVQLMFDGGVLAIQRARADMLARRIAGKGYNFGLAIEIVDTLRIAVDPRHDSRFAEQLTALYRYLTARLLQANLRNDPAIVDECARILGGLQAAWRKIAPAAGQAGAPPPRSAAAVAARALAPPAYRRLDAYQA